MPAPVVAAATGGAGVAGLVSIQTSATPLVCSNSAFVDSRVFVDSQMMRWGKLKRSVMTSARLHDEEMSASGRRHKVAFVTLTYADGVEWSPKHVTAFLKAVREWLKRRGYPLRYVWVLETTKRKRPHYHLAIWLPKSLSLPKPDKRGWWTHGISNIQLARCPLAYLAKYASKGSDCYPGGARIYGTGGLSAKGRVARRWWLAPKWLRDAVPLSDVRKDRGGWRDSAGGLHLSPYVYGGQASGGFYIRKRQFGDPLYTARDMSSVIKADSLAVEVSNEAVYLRLLELEDKSRVDYVNFIHRLIGES